MKNTGAIAPGYRADILISKDITAQKIEYVFKDGKMIARDGKALFDSVMPDTGTVTDTVHIREYTKEDFEIEFKEGMPAIRVLPHSLLTDGVSVDSQEGLNYCAVIERHKGTGNIGKCFIKDFNLKGGAIAQSIGHDSHNITVVGSDTESMAVAVNALGKSGGMSVVKNGELLSFMPLPIGGIMSDKNAEKTLEAHEEILSSLQRLECGEGIDAFMMLSFLSLLVIPNVKISDKGLFDVNKFNFIKQ